MRTIHELVSDIAKTSPPPGMPAPFTHGTGKGDGFHLGHPNGALLTDLAELAARSTELLALLPKAKAAK